MYLCRGWGPVANDDFECDASTWLRPFRFFSFPQDFNGDVLKKEAQEERKYSRRRLN
jgi:hypothetical protein